MFSMHLVLETRMQTYNLLEDQTPHPLSATGAPPDGVTAAAPYHRAESAWISRGKQASRDTQMMMCAAALS
jgi:hypothetical protein